MASKYQWARGLGVVLAAFMLIITVAGNAANAEAFGEIRPVFAKDGGLFGGPKCLAIYGPDGFFTNFARVVTWDCNGNDDQHWTVSEFGVVNGQRLVAVKNTKSGKCIEPVVITSFDGASVEQYNCLGSDIQLWIVSAVGPSIYKLENYSLLRNGGRHECLDVFNSDNGNGVKVEVWPCNGNENQQFQARVFDL